MILCGWVFFFFDISDTSAVIRSAPPPHLCSVALLWPERLSRSDSARRRPGEDNPPTAAEAVSECLHRLSPPSPPPLPLLLSFCRPLHSTSVWNQSADEGTEV